MPTTTNITRADLIDAVEFAIKEAKVSNDHAAALRPVAHRADRVARAAFVHDGVGCPLHQAGLTFTDEDGSLAVGTADLLNFAFRFDDATRTVGGREHMLDVVG